MTVTRRGLIAAAGLAAPGIAPALAQANRFPDRPVELVVGFTAGGATDLDARAVAPLLEKRLGGTVVVVNRPGAGGEVALASVARSRPDGHTLGTTNMPGLLTIPIERRAQFTLADFAGVANLVTDPNAITVHQDSPYQSVQDIMAAAKARPDHLTFASTGVGTDDHLLLVLMQKATGTSFIHVVFQGDPQLFTAILGKQVEVLGLNLGPVSAQPDKLRTLAMAGATRSRFRPEVPTLKELGIDVVMGSERGVVAPAATPPAVLAKLREAMADAVKDPEFARILQSRFTEPGFEDGEAWFTRLRSLQEGYRTLWERTPWAQR